MKRKPLNRFTPLRAKKPWNPERKPLRQRSAKQAALYRDERVPLVKEMLAENPYCELARFIHRIEPHYRDCRKTAIGLHELLKRSAGGSITERENLLRCCAPCNSWVEDFPDLAWEAGLVIRRGETYEDAKHRRRGFKM